jgi:hypothetical protein
MPTKRVLSIPGQSPEADAFMAMAVAMASELSATRARLDTLERVLEQSGLSVRGPIEAFKPTAEEQAERDALRMHTIERVFRVIRKMSEAELETLAAKEDVA